MKTLQHQSHSISEQRTILGSQFIALLHYTPTTQDFTTFLKRIREEHPKATHHCQAYRINPESTQEFASDDGEPSGTAGLPMLNVLKKFELVNVGAIVIRYFGGTKLGKKGLIDAYREVTEQAILSTDIKTVQKKSVFNIQYPYAASNEIQRMVHVSNASIQSEAFGEFVSIKVHVGLEDALPFQQKIDSMQHLGISNEHVGHIFE